MERVGDLEIITKKRIWRDCDLCGNYPAAFKFTFLLPNARQNRGSSAYNRDDCSWCSDEDIYTCKKCSPPNKDKYPLPRIKSEQGNEFCGIFILSRFKHMGFTWIKVNTLQP